jgi:hypothetical protein
VNGTAIIVICTVVTMVVTVAAWLGTVVKGARERAAAEQSARAAELKVAADGAHADGAASRDAEVQRLKDQRDDARRERDEAKTEGAETLRRLNRLLDHEGEQP